MTRRLEAGPLLVTLGAVLLLVSLFLSWYTSEITAWQAFEVWDLVLFVLALASIAAGLGLTTQDVDLVDRRFLPVAVAAVAIVVASQIIDPPPAAPGQDPDTGIWLALGGSLVMCLGAVLMFGRVHLALTVEGRDQRRHVSAVDARGPTDPTTEGHVGRAAVRPPAAVRARAGAGAGAGALDRRDDADRAQAPGRESSRRGEAGLMPVREVAFELECFEWADERLEVAGRWKGLAGRRLNRPVLTVETEGGRRKHLVAMPGGHFGAAEESWRAAFDWPGDPAEIIGAELEVGGKIVVDLPLPDRKRRRRRRQPADTGDEVLRSEIGALRGQVERLRSELAGRERENMQLREQIDEDEEGEPLVSEAGASTVEIRPPVAPREDLSAELERLESERDQTRDELSAEVERLHGERDRMRLEIERLQDENLHARADVDDLREAFADAAAEAEEVRDRHRAEVAAIEEEVRAERATVARLTAELAAGPELPPPRTPSARRRAPWAAARPAAADEEVVTDEDRLAAAFAADDSFVDDDPLAGDEGRRAIERRPVTRWRPTTIRSSATIERRPVTRWRPARIPSSAAIERRPVTRWRPTIPSSAAIKRRPARIPSSATTERRPVTRWPATMGSSATTEWRPARIPSSAAIERRPAMMGSPAAIERRPVPTRPPPARPVPSTLTRRLGGPLRRLRRRSR